MKIAIAVLLALVPAWAQIAKPVAPGSAAGSPKALRASFPAVGALEKTFDANLRAFNFNDPIDLLGDTRGLYLEGYGVVFTTELSLIVTPGLSPFHQTITEPEKASVYQRKLARLPAIRQLMTKMMQSSAPVLNFMPDTEQVVLAVKLLYLPWEKTEGMPGMILMKATRRNAIAGQIQTDEQ